MRSRLKFGLASAALGILVLSGCSHNEGSSSTTTTASTATTSAATPADTGNTIKVGVLHSLSGTMAISEVSVKNSEMMAIDEINKSGGVMGKQLVPVVEDGASDWPTFAEKTKKLLEEDKVSVIFGCWTSASRKAVKPVLEAHHGLLFYPVQYEGLESSPDIYYTGAEPTEQIVPAVTWMLKKGWKKIFLLGSDYVFPRTANKIIKAQLAANGGTLAGEEYTPLGSTEYSTVISKIKAAHPDAVFNTLNGDSNVAFFKQLKDAGITAKQMPVMSVSVAEVEAKGIGPENIAGDYCAWNYFETTKTPENKKFVADYKALYPADPITDDPIEAGYFGVYLWKAMVEKAKSTGVDDILKVADGTSFSAPEGMVKIDGANHHTWKTVRIGQFRPDGLVNEVWSSGKPVEPDPYLTRLPWAKGIAEGQPTPVSVMEK